MIFTNAQIVNHINTIPLVANVVLPVRITYAIKKNYRKFVTEYQDYDEQLQDLRVKYPDQKELEDSEDIKTLLAIEVDVDIFKIPESIFETGDFSITPAQIEALEFMIETETEIESK